MYGCESWTIKKAECWRIDAFKLWCWRRLLRVPWTARRTNQCILKEINFEYSLEERMLKLKLQYFGHLMRSANSLEKTPMLGEIEARRRSRQQRIWWLDGITDSVNMSFEQTPGDSEGQGSLECCKTWGCRVEHNLATEQQQTLRPLLTEVLPFSHMQKFLIINLSLSR